MTVRLAEMTWPDVERAVARGATTVLLPLGATEQHGPHLPLGTDTVRAVALAEGLANVVPGILVAPALPIGCSDEHSGFAGLLGLDHATLAQVIVDCGWRMAGWGVKRLVLLSAHGGNGQAVELACTQLKGRAKGLEVLVLAASATLTDTLSTVAAADGITADAVGLHAGEGETSEMLQLCPELVRMDRAVAGYSGSMLTVIPQLRQFGVREVSRIGTLGDPRQASASRGATYLAAQIDSFSRDLAATTEGGAKEAAAAWAAGR